MSLIRTAFAAIAAAFALLYAAVVGALWLRLGALPAGILAADAPAVLARLGHVRWQLMLAASVAFAVVGMLLAGALLALHRRGLRPLAQFDAQIRAIGERRFVCVVEPDIAEWVRLSKSLNVMVSRVQLMLEERDARLAGLRAEVDMDALTGVASRGAFTGAFQAALQAPGDAAVEAGAVVIIRLHDLVGMNQRAGRERTDELLRGVATALRTRLFRHEAAGGLLGRLNGADFAVLLPAVRGEALLHWLQSVDDLMRALHDAQVAETRNVAWIGASTYRAGETLSDVLSRCDAMVGAAETQRLPYAVTSPSQPLHTISVAQWRTVIEQALGMGALHLDFYPVQGRDDTVLHREAMLRLRGPDGTPIPAGIFIPPAVRTGRIVDLDLRTVSLALAELRSAAGDVAVKLSPNSLARPMFHARLAELLADSAAEAPRLWIEVDESVLESASDDLDRLVAAAASHGCRVGIEHFGHRLSWLPRLTDLHVSHIKLRATVCHGVNDSSGQRTFAELTVRLASAAGILVIAQGVRREADLACLARLGVLGATGPLVSERLAAASVAATAH